MLCAAAVARGDGKVFGYGVPRMPPIPDQQAIIAWEAAASTETLAIETRFDAGSTKAAGSTPPAGDAAYCWVVPLPGPAAPKISSATTGLFPTVRAVFQPRVDDRSAPDSIGFTITLIVLLTIYVLLRHWNWPRLGALVLVFIAVLFVGVVMLPTLGKARSAARRVEGVEVLDRSIVGSYETTVIGASADSAQADSGKALSKWLADNGFPLPANAAPVLADYAARRWVFAAIKLMPDAAAGGHLTPHPLVFRFATPRAVYPMALTGVGNSPLMLDLYVFGPQRAAAAGLTEVRCDRCKAAGAEHLGVLAPADCVAVGHPGLAEIVGSLPIATKLSGTLSPAGQARDMEIAWGEFAQSGAHRFSPRAAAFRGMEISAGVVLAGIVILIVAGSRRKQGGPTWTAKKLVWTLPLGAAIGLVVYAFTPTIAVRQEGFRTAQNNMLAMLREIPTELSFAFEKHAAAPTIVEIQKAVDDLAKERGFETRLEDSPGNYTIERESDGSMTCVSFDAVGTPHREAFWWPPEPPSAKAAQPSR
jgi:hypothetical protein